MQQWFEKLSLFTAKVLGHWLSFLLAFIFILSWLSGNKFEAHTLHEDLRDIIIAITFLSLFLLQKLFNKLNAALHIKLNELVSAHDKASNQIINVEEKTEKE